MAVTALFNKAMKRKWQEAGAYLCAKCGGPDREGDPLEVSHFFNVRWSGTRFRPSNVDPLHRSCHTGNAGWEYQKAEGRGYHDYMLGKLGADGLRLLGTTAHTQMSLDAAKAKFIEKLEGGQF